MLVLLFEKKRDEDLDQDVNDGKGKSGLSSCGPSQAWAYIISFHFKHEFLFQCQTSGQQL